MRRRVAATVVIAAAVALGLSASASAESRLAYTDVAGSVNDIVRIDNSDVAGYQFSYSAGCFFGCSFRVESLQGFDDQAAACTAITDPTSFSCDADGAAGLQVPGNVSVTGSAGGDSVDGSCFLASPRLTTNMGDGDDRVTVANFCVGSHNINLDAGNDTAVAAGTISGGAGRDSIKGSTANDTLIGGDGRDTLEGLGGTDNLQGAEGRDLLVPGVGNGDVAQGGGDVDTASYEDRAASQPLTVSLDNQANDGVSGENDRIAADVENLIGGDGDDTLSGDAQPNDIEGGSGGDVIDPRGGPDLVNSGIGNDRVSARDGAQDRIDCGAGNDLAITDQFDSVSNCESLQASRELMPDVDADGVAAPVDCDDRDARRRPGFIDKPGNEVDEDCTGGDAPFARIFSTVQSTFTAFRRFTRVNRLRVVGIPERSRIELRCRGGKKRGCFTKVKRYRVRRGAEAKDIRRPLRKSKLRKGAQIEVRILAADSIGKVQRFTMRSGFRLPTSKTLCLVPGRKQPGRCPRR